MFMPSVAQQLVIAHPKATHRALFLQTGDPKSRVFEKAILKYVTLFTEKWADGLMHRNRMLRPS